MPWTLMWTALLWMLCLGGQTAHAGTTEPATLDDSAYKKKEDDAKTDDQKTEEQQKAEEEAEKKRKETLARVIVLKWPGTSTDFSDESVRRNVRSRIAAPEAMFFPEVDLYQNGRKVLDRTVLPTQQPAVVPDSAIPLVMQQVQAIAGVPWNGLQPPQWGLKAQELQRLAEQFWFVDRPELREPLFLLYAQIGRAAENQNHPAPPFYEQIGPYAVNYYYYLAATLAYQEPGLMSKLTDSDLNSSIGYYLTQLQQGSFPSFKVDFEQENIWDPAYFNDTYEVLINGLPVELKATSEMDAFLGRTDIYLKRKDGHGLSERLEVTKLDEKIYFVRDVARKRVGDDFIDQLFLHPNECYPEIDGDILNYLAIYAKLHGRADVYIAVPENGNPNKVWIWRYMRDRGMLQLVGGGPDGFPVHFAFVVSPGLLWNGASVQVDDNLSDENSIATDPSALTSRADTALKSAAVPINFEMRGHYNRLMVNMGAEFGWNATPSSHWIDRYYLPQHQAKNAAIALQVKHGSLVRDADGNAIEAYHETVWNRYLYMGGGVVLGRDAGLGFGPRFAARIGWTNLPHALQTTAHFGWAIQPPIGKLTGRVRPLLDADLRGGISYAFAYSLQADLAAAGTESRLMPVFGLSVGAGLTF